MAMRREIGAQGDLVVTWAEMPCSPRHAFYDRLQELLREARFDAIVEKVCKTYYAARMGAPYVPAPSTQPLPSLFTERARRHLM